MAIRNKEKLYRLYRKSYASFSESVAVRRNDKTPFSEAWQFPACFSRGSPSTETSYEFETGTEPPTRVYTNSAGMILGHSIIIFNGNGHVR